MIEFPGPSEPPDEPHSCSWGGLIQAMRFYSAVELEMSENEQWCLLQTIANQFVRGDLFLLRDILLEWAGEIDR